MSTFHEHGVLLYLSPELYVAFIKLQADKGLGRSYAGLLAFVEGVYRLGYLDKEAYERCVRKYSQGLEKPNVKEESRCIFCGRQAVARGFGTYGAKLLCEVHLEKEKPSLKSWVQLNEPFNPNLFGAKPLRKEARP